MQSLFVSEEKLRSIRFLFLELFQSKNSQQDKAEFYDFLKILLAFAEKNLVSDTNDLNYKVIWVKFIKTVLVKVNQLSDKSAVDFYLCILAELLFIINHTFALLFCYSSLAYILIEKFGTKQQKLKYLQQFFTGELLIICLFNEENFEIEKLKTFTILKQNKILLEGKKLAQQLVKINNQKIAYLVLAKNGKQDNWFFIDETSNVNFINRTNNAIEFKKGCLVELFDNSANQFEYFKKINSLFYFAQTTAACSIALNSINNFFHNPNLPLLKKSEILNKATSNELESCAFIYSLAEGISRLTYHSIIYASKNEEHSRKMLQICCSLLRNYCLQETESLLLLSIKLLNSNNEVITKKLKTILLNLNESYFYTDPLRSDYLEHSKNKKQINSIGFVLEVFLNEFSCLDKQTPKLKIVKELLGVWRDYLGGFILLVDSLKNNKNRDNLEIFFSRRIIGYLGDLLIAYFLIKQLFIIEKKLEEAYIEFNELFKYACQENEFRFYHNFFLVSEYFIHNILSRQEGTLKIVKRDCDSALFLLF